MIAPIFLPLLQKAINNYLSLDTEIRSRLKKLSGKVMCVEITLIGAQFYLHIQNETIHLLPSYHGAIDASLRGTPFAFIETWVHHLQGNAAVSKDLEISGDVHFVQTINDIFQKIDIDWEEQLSKFTGDIIAHQIGNLGRNFNAWLTDTKTTISTNFSEYLQEEIKILPARLAIEDFCNDVDSLRDDVERFILRFGQYLNT